LEVMTAECGGEKNPSTNREKGIGGRPFTTKKGTDQEDGLGKEGRENKGNFSEIGHEAMKSLLVSRR